MAHDMLDLTATAAIAVLSLSSLLFFRHPRAGGDPGLFLIALDSRLRGDDN